MKKSFNAVRSAGLGAALILAAGLMTACGSSTDSSGPQTALDTVNEELAAQNSGQDTASGEQEAYKDPDSTEVLDESAEERISAKEKIETLDFREIAKKNLEAKKDMTIGVVTSSGGVEDESFNQSAWEGLQWLSGRNGCEVKYMESETVDQFRDNLTMMVEEGGDFCWGIGYSCADDLKAVAEDNPDRYFAVVDYYYDDCPDNVTGVMFRAEEPSFLVGYIAASFSEKHKIGFIGGEDTVIIDQFLYGYMAGIKYADNENGTETELLTEYAGSFTDSDKGYELARHMYDEGCDVVFHASGETGIGVITAAKDTGLYCIGVDKDQAYLAPDNVLTSALKYVNVAVQEVSEEFLNGGDISGMNISMGLREGAVGVSEIHNLYSESLYEKMLELSDRIKNDELIPPSDEAEYSQFVKELK